MKNLFAVTFVASSIAVMSLAGCASAQTDHAGVVKTRQDGMKANGAANRAIREELAKPAPSLPVIKENVAKLKDIAPKIITWFPAGSGPESGIKTKALPAIWEKPDEFKKAHQGYEAALTKFAGIVDGGDMATIKPGFAELGKGCGGCHNTFREKEEQAPPR